MLFIGLLATCSELLAAGTGSNGERRVLAVFAGGPHTRSRIALARELVPVLKPVTVIFTGSEFFDLDPALLAASAGDVPFVIEPASTTLESCVRLARSFRAGLLTADTIVTVTSNYHRPRLWWLLRTALPSSVAIRIEASRDMGWRDVFCSRVARRLAVGEVISWLYCFPVGIGLWLMR
ncbi:MAG: hypothetical protein N2255_07140 [Kiritimatiellae bacterium]|nr:hypothetical protein [Kiritimatiellia bacterium]